MGGAKLCYVFHRLCLQCSLSAQAKGDMPRVACRLGCKGAKVSHLWASKADRMSEKRGWPCVNGWQILRSISPLILGSGLSVSGSMHYSNWNPNTTSLFTQKQRLREICVSATSVSGPVWAQILGPASWLMQLFSGRRALASRSAQTVQKV